MPTNVRLWWQQDSMIWEMTFQCDEDLGGETKPGKVLAWLQTLLPASVAGNVIIDYTVSVKNPGFLWLVSSASDWVGFHLVSSWNSLWSTSLSSSPSSWHKVNKKRAAKNLCHISGFLYSPLHPGLLLMKLKIRWWSDCELLTTLTLLPHPATALVSLEKDSPPVLPPLACLSGCQTCQIWLDKRVVLGNLECSCLHPRLPMLPKHCQVVTNHVISSAALQLSSTQF